MIRSTSLVKNESMTSSIIQVVSRIEGGLISPTVGVIEIDVTNWIEGETTSSTTRG